MRKFPIKGLLLALPLLMASCIKGPMEPEECLYNLRLEFEFVDTSPLSYSELLNVNIMSGNTNRDHVISELSGHELELPSGAFGFVVAERADNVTINDFNGAVSVTKDTDGTALQPGRFSGGFLIAQVLPNAANQVIHLPLRQQTRDLVITVKFKGAGMPYINGVDGAMNGITISRNINDGFLPENRQSRPPAIESGTIKYAFARDTDPVATSFSGRKALLGVAGNAQQKLDLSVKTSLGIVNDFSLDVADSLNEFHITNVHEPWYIVLELEIDTRLEMTIQDWYVGTEHNLIAQ